MCNKTLSEIMALHVRGREDLRFSVVIQKEALVTLAKSIYFFE